MVEMAYYHLRIYYHYSNFWTKIFGTPINSDFTTFIQFFNLSKKEVEEIKEGKEQDRPFWVGERRFEPQEIVSITVYETSKKTSDYSADSDMQLSEVMNWIMNGRIGKNVTKLFFPLSVIDEEAHSKIDDLISAAKFLGLDENWFISTCALQLQETMIARLSKNKGILLDKENIKKILNKKEVKVPSEYVPFGEKYKAFSIAIKSLDDIIMPNLTLELIRMRNDVLHNGYNPTTEEATCFVSYTTDLLNRLNDSIEKH